MKQKHIIILFITLCIMSYQNTLGQSIRYNSSKFILFIDLTEKKYKLWKNTETTVKEDRFLPSVTLPEYIKESKLKIDKNTITCFDVNYDNKPLIVLKKIDEYRVVIINTNLYFNKNDTLYSTIKTSKLLVLQ